jgi:hypothetical protein
MPRFAAAKIPIKMKLKHLLCLILAVAARAANYIGDQTFSAPFALNENVNVVGNLTFATPGTYSATTWTIVGFIRFAQPGTYTVVATTGGFAVSGNAVGPANGTATIRVNYQTTVNFVGTVATNLIVVDESGARPPTIMPVDITPPPPAPLMNLSTRATLVAGGVLSPGFVIGGTTPRRVLIRAIGPGLAPFGVTGVMANPTLAVFNGALQIGANDDWSGDVALDATFAAVGAFGLPPASRDAALVVTLPPGAYTATVRGATAADAGEVLVEVYFVH